MMTKENDKIIIEEVLGGETEPGGKMFVPARGILAHYPEGWPPVDFFVSEHNLTGTQCREFRYLVEHDSKEREIDGYLRNNKEIISNMLTFTRTGHHGSWIIPQQLVRPSQGPVNKGLIPDYLVGGRNSDGFQWGVFELKGADDSLFSETNGSLRFSRSLNHGIVQLLEYLNYCTSAQSYLRDTLNLSGFGTAFGYILIGREHELTENRRRQELKAAWNACVPRLQIRTYDALLRVLEDKERFLDETPESE